jgi:hypothetical protein
MPIVEYQVNSVAELIEKLRPIYRRSKTVWFRGHRDGRWNLDPSLSREKKLDRELELAKRFKQNAFQFLSRIPTEEWEWMFLMQHYGVPTRLLDWTENPLVGLYFATREDQFKRGAKMPSAVVWCLFPQKLNEMAGMVLGSVDDIPAFGDEKELADYLPSQVLQTSSSKNPLAIIAPRQFERVYAQQGVFTIMHREARHIEQLHPASGDPNHLAKLVIPRRSVSRIQRELAILRVTKLTVFPQLENVAEAACQL